MIEYLTAFASIIRLFWQPIKSCKTKYSILLATEKYTYDNYRFFDGQLYDDENPKQYGQIYRLTKYNQDYQFNSLDGKTTLEPGDDVATMRLGDGWRMPTKEEWENFLELANEEFETNEEGVIFTFKNGEKLMLPFTGYYSTNGGGFRQTGEFYYWSSTLTTEQTTFPGNGGPGSNIYGY